MLADIITLDMKNINPVLSLVSNIVYCANGNTVRDSIINGRLVMQERELLV
jgi:cytosine/adenosine deaminase-related metal-dependent hydrolase